ncbi:MAG TPA: DUF503 family protein [Isosphaeraceae bacterium]|jgi:hypothetical protein|nr:DUF503 family protein [Isosphaeraceae bacterium]
MTVATLRLELRVGDCPSLRERRRRLGRIAAKLRRYFNVSVAEDDRIGTPTQGALVAAAVGNSRVAARDVLERVADAVAAHPQVELLAQALHEV